MIIYTETNASKYLYKFINKEKYIPLFSNAAVYYVTYLVPDDNNFIGINKQTFIMEFKKYYITYVVSDDDNCIMINEIFFIMELGLEIN